MDASFVRGVVFMLPLLLGMGVMVKSGDVRVLPQDFKGVNIFARNSTLLAQPTLLQEVKDIAKLGANWVVVDYEIYQDNATSNVIYTNPKKTPSHEMLGVFIDAAHALGLKVLLKPLVVCSEGGCTFFDIIPSNPAAWFRSYLQYMELLASFCALKHVDALSVGLEFYHFSGAAYTTYWKDVINTIRARYPPPGLLTYCSIFWPVETQLVQFWGMLDFIAMDTYVPFIKNATTDPAPTEADMLARFYEYFALLHHWHSSQPANVSRLPIIMTEVGYPSCKQGMATPSADIPSSCEGSTWASNTTLQQMAFDTLFKTLSTTHPNVVAGLALFWFDNPSTSDWYSYRNLPSSTWPCSWTPRGKPAECTIAKAYGGVASISKCS
jgi:hypothetical protein